MSEAVIAAVLGGHFTILAAYITVASRRRAKNMEELLERLGAMEKDLNRLRATKPDANESDSERGAT